LSHCRGQALIIDIQGVSGEASREASVESRGQLKKYWLAVGGVEFAEGSARFGDASGIVVGGFAVCCGKSG
jgi:hypothetical protein